VGDELAREVPRIEGYVNVCEGPSQKNCRIRKCLPTQVAKWVTKYVDVACPVVFTLTVAFNTSQL
jgi:hypothetical protein